MDWSGVAEKTGTGVTKGDYRLVGCGVVRDW